MRSVALPRFLSKIPGFISYVILSDGVFCEPQCIGIKNRRKQTDESDDRNEG